MSCICECGVRCVGVVAAVLVVAGVVVFVVAVAGGGSIADGALWKCRFRGVSHLTARRVESLSPSFDSSKNHH